jgi:acyl-CoA carboxylase subunit beta
MLDQQAHEASKDLGQKIKTKVKPSMEAFQKNYKEMSDLVFDLRLKLRSSLNQGRDKDIARHLSKEQLMARDRVELLLDEDSPFLELMPLAGYGQEDIPVGASIIVGIGLVWYVFS